MYNTCTKMKPNLYKSVYKNQVSKPVSLFNNKKHNLSRTNSRKPLWSNILLYQYIKNREIWNIKVYLNQISRDCWRQTKFSSKEILLRTIQ